MCVCMCVCVCVWGSKCSPWRGTRAWGSIYPWWQQLEQVYECMCECWRVDEAMGAVHVCVSAGGVDLCGRLCVYVCDVLVCAWAGWEHTLSFAAGWMWGHRSASASPLLGCQIWQSLTWMSVFIGATTKMRGTEASYLLLPSLLILLLLQGGVWVFREVHATNGKTQRLERRFNGQFNGKVAPGEEFCPRKPNCQLEYTFQPALHPKLSTTPTLCNRTWGTWAENPSEWWH